MFVRALIALTGLLIASPCWSADTPDTGKWQLQTDQSPTSRKHTNVSIRLDADAEVTGWPDDRKETPTLVVDCNRGKLRIYIVTKLRPEVYGDYYDDFLAMTRIGFDGKAPDAWRLRRSSTGEEVHFPRVKLILRELIVSDTMFFEFTPFSSPPTNTSFDLRGIRQAVEPLKHSCKIQTDAVPGR
jgi:type VI secretion system protein VasI